MLNIPNVIGMRRWFASSLLISITTLQNASAQKAQAPPLPESSLRLMTPAKDAFALYQWYTLDPAGEWRKVVALKEGTGTTRTLLDSALHVQAMPYVAHWARQRVPSLQLDPLGELSVTAGDVAQAQHMFSERLATPGLSLADRAYTLVTAIRAFSHEPADTARMRIARHYLQQLDALPASPTQSRFAGHVSMADAYYLDGQGADVVNHLGQALALLPDLSFEDRCSPDIDFGLAELFRWADVTSGLPRGRAQIDSMVAWIRPLLQVPPALATSYRSYRQLSVTLPERFKNQVKAIALLGRPAPPITAQFWLNTTRPATPSPDAPGAQIKTLDDGIIRVLEIGHYGCPGCLLKLPMMERLRQTLPANVEMWMVSDEYPMWGMKRTTPEEQVQFLSDYYRQRGYRFPIAIFIGVQDVMDPDLGRMVSRENPTKYPMKGWPWFVVTDGRGIVRHIGMFDDEDVLRATVKYLTAEAAHRDPAPIPPTH